MRGFRGLPQRCEVAGERYFAVLVFCSAAQLCSFKKQNEYSYYIDEHLFFIIWLPCTQGGALNWALRCTGGWHPYFDNWIMSFWGYWSKDHFLPAGTPDNWLCADNWEFLVLIHDQTFFCTSYISYSVHKLVADQKNAHVVSHYFFKLEGGKVITDGQTKKICSKGYWVGERSRRHIGQYLPQHVAAPGMQGPHGQPVQVVCLLQIWVIRKEPAWPWWLPSICTGESGIFYV